ncbi:hypothetical protein ACWEOZ_12265 [Actinoplanes sp. NPDC004185]
MRNDLFSLYEPNESGSGPREWLISSDERDRIEDQFFRVRSGTVPLLNEHVLVRQCFDPRGNDQIRAEISAGQWLSHRLSKRNYPHWLSRLVAFNQDGDRPATTVFTLRGESLDALPPDKFPFREQRLLVAAREILAAVEALEVAGVVHGRISPETVRWDDNQIQLVDFRRAARIGEQRQAFRRDDRWASPEQQLGDGVSHPGDDVFGAALLIFKLVTGEDPGTPAEMRRRLEARPGSMQRLFAGVFADFATERPSAGAMLARLPGATMSVPGAARPARDQQARARFRELERRKNDYVRRQQEAARQQQIARQREAARQQDIARRQEEARREAARQQEAVWQQKVQQRALGQQRDPGRRQTSSERPGQPGTTRYPPTEARGQGVRQGRPTSYGRSAPTQAPHRPSKLPMQRPAGSPGRRVEPQEYGTTRPPALQRNFEELVIAAMDLPPWIRAAGAVIVIVIGIAVVALIVGSGS